MKLKKVHKLGIIENTISNYFLHNVTRGDKIDGPTGI
jgi:hypothetical protein